MPILLLLHFAIRLVHVKSWLEVTYTSKTQEQILLFQKSALKPAFIKAGEMEAIMEPKLILAVLPLFRIDNQLWTK